MKFIIFLTLFLSSLSFGQQVGVFKNIKLLPTSLPSTCSIGDLRFDTSGHLVNYCYPANTWNAFSVSSTSPLTTLGDLLYESATPSPTRLAGNTTSTKKFLTQTGTGSISAAPAWATIASADVLPINLASTANGGVSGVLPIANGGTNNGSLGVAAGGVYYADGSKLVQLVAGTSGQILTSGGASAPTWGAATGLITLNSQAGSTQVFANDTNVTITSSNNTHSIGWSGVLAISRGGTNNGSLAPVLGGITYTDATKLNTLAAGTSNQVLMSNGAAAPTWGNFIKADGSIAFTGNQSLGGFALQSVLSPVNANDAATKTYVDAQLAQLNPAAAVYAASIANVGGTYTNVVGGVCIGDTFTTTATTAFALDGTSPAVASRVLLKDQTNSFQDGVWTLTTQAVGGISGAILTRALDFDSSADINSGQIVPIVNGTVNAGASWYQTATNTTCNTSTQTWTQFQKASSSYLQSLNSQTNSTQVFANDTNVTITSSNNTHTLGWTGALSIARGGSNNGSLGPVLGGVVYTDASKLVTLAAGTSGQVLTSNGAAAPSWATASGSGITTLNSQTGATQIFANDTNVTITSSNNTHTLGFTGSLSTARGGTNNASLAPVLGGIIYADATKLNTLAAGTSGQVLKSGGAAAPTWGTAGLGTASEQYYDTGSGNGSTDTMIRRITTNRVNSGSDITCSTGSVHGLACTINTAGVYIVHFQDRRDGGPCQIGISVNEGTSDMASTTPGNLTYATGGLIRIFSSNAGDWDEASVTHHFSVNDVVRPTTDGNCNATPSGSTVFDIVGPIAN